MPDPVCSLSDDSKRSGENEASRAQRRVSAIGVEGCSVN